MQKSHPVQDGFSVKSMSGSALLSHGETPHYHRRDGVSLLSSAWGQVGPPRYCRQTNPVFNPEQAAGLAQATPVSETFRLSLQRPQNPFGVVRLSRTVH